MSQGQQEGRVVCRRVLLLAAALLAVAASAALGASQAASYQADGGAGCSWSSSVPDEADGGSAARNRAAAAAPRNATRRPSLPALILQQLGRDVTWPIRWLLEGKHAALQEQHAAEQREYRQVQLTCRILEDYVFDAGRAMQTAARNEQLQAVRISVRELRVLHVALANEGCLAAGAAEELADWASSAAEELQRERALGVQLQAGAQPNATVAAAAVSAEAPAADGVAATDVAAAAAAAGSVPAAAPAAEAGSGVSEAAKPVAATAETAPQAARSQNASMAATSAASNGVDARAAASAKGGTVGQQTKTGAQQRPPGLWGKILGPLRSSAGKRQPDTTPYIEALRRHMPLVDAPPPTPPNSAADNPAAAPPQVAAHRPAAAAAARDDEGRGSNGAIGGAASGAATQPAGGVTELSRRIQVQRASGAPPASSGGDSGGAAVAEPAAQDAARPGGHAAHSRAVDAIVAARMAGWHLQQAAGWTGCTATASFAATKDAAAAAWTAARGTASAAARRLTRPLPPPRQLLADVAVAAGRAWRDPESTRRLGQALLWAQAALFLLYLPAWLEASAEQDGIVSMIRPSTQPRQDFDFDSLRPSGPDSGPSSPVPPSGGDGGSVLNSPNGSGLRPSLHEGFTAVFDSYAPEPPSSRPALFEEPLAASAESPAPANSSPQAGVRPPVADFPEAVAALSQAEGLLHGFAAPDAGAAALTSEGTATLSRFSVRMSRSLELDRAGSSHAAGSPPSAAAVAAADAADAAAADIAAPRWGAAAAEIPSAVATSQRRASPEQHRVLTALAAAKFELASPLPPPPPLEALHEVPLQEAHPPLAQRSRPGAAAAAGVTPAPATPVPTASAPRAADTTPLSIVPAALGRSFLFPAASAPQAEPPAAAAGDAATAGSAAEAAEGSPLQEGLERVPGFRLSLSELSSSAGTAPELSEARAVLAEANAALSSPRGAAAEAAAVLAGLDQTLKDNAMFGSITSPLKAGEESRLPVRRISAALASRRLPASSPTSTAAAQFGSSRAGSGGRSSPGSSSISSSAGDGWGDGGRGSSCGGGSLSAAASGEKSLPAAAFQPPPAAKPDAAAAVQLPEAPPPEAAVSAAVPADGAGAAAGTTATALLSSDAGGSSYSPSSSPSAASTASTAEMQPLRLAEPRSSADAAEPPPSAAEPLPSAAEPPAAAASPADAADAMQQEPHQPAAAAAGTAEVPRPPAPAAQTASSLPLPPPEAAAGAPRAESQEAELLHPLQGHPLAAAGRSASTPLLSPQLSATPSRIPRPTFLPRPALATALPAAASTAEMVHAAGEGMTASASAAREGAGGGGSGQGNCAAAAAGSARIGGNGS